MPHQDASLPHVVIIGGGFGGLFAARALRGAPVRITLIDRQNHHLFQPLLYQVATAVLSPGDIASPIRWILRGQPNVRVLLAEVTDIDPTGRTVTLEGRETLAYDQLIVAAGATHSYFGHEAWAAHAPGLKTLDDALELRRRVLLAFERAERETDPGRQRQWLTFAIVGGGPTGVELAGSLIEIARQTLRREFRMIDPESARVLLIEAGPSILASFPESLRERGRRSLRRLGVEVWERAAVTDIGDGFVQVGADPIPVETVIWAAGVAASPLGRALGVPLDRAGRVVVAPDLSIPGHPEVFVIGDLAHCPQPSGTPLPGVAQVAMQGATWTAANIRRRLAGQPTTPFRYRDLGNMATIGRASAVADLGWARFSGFPAWLAWLFIHLVWLVGFRSKVSVLLQWATSYVTFQRSVRLITGPPPAPPPLRH
ncbi:MAG: NAD(P)/FAD-dependent oxidoreductase [Vicinamibacterales bacterium]|nr:NAD(P)/FAD-dependent oxidoreductase [Vicinamibacterales bacterium]